MRVFISILVFVVLVSCNSAGTKNEAEGKASKGLFGLKLGESALKLTATKIREEAMFSPGSPFHGIVHIDYTVSGVPEPVAYFSKIEIQTSQTGVIYGISGEGKSDCQGRKEYSAMLSALTDKYGKGFSTKDESIGTSAEWVFSGEPRKAVLTLACWGDSMMIFMSDRGILLDETAKKHDVELAPEKAKINTNGI